MGTNSRRTTFHRSPRGAGNSTKGGSRGSGQKGTAAPKRQIAAVASATGLDKSSAAIIQAEKIYAPGDWAKTQRAVAHHAADKVGGSAIAKVKAALLARAYPVIRPRAVENTVRTERLDGESKSE